MACRPESTTSRAARNDWASSVGEPLRVEAPTLDVRRAGHAGAEDPERRQPLQLHLDADLEVMAGRRLVEGDRGDLVELSLLGLIGVDVVLRLTRAIHRRRDVERGR
jgi:hypothetical protein